jgi:energy-coupling factor transporter ATP-binding protein EcfA2
MLARLPLDRASGNRCPMVKLQWLQINKFRSVKPGTRLTFNPGYNVLLGQNGTGKTTLLNLVAAVVQSNFGELREIDFDLQYELASDTSTATISVRNERAPRPNPADPAFQQPGMTLEEMLPIDMGSTEPVFSTRIELESKHQGRTLIKAQGNQGILSVLDGKALEPPLSFGSSTASQLNLMWLLYAIIQKALNAHIPYLLELRKIFSERQMLRFDEALDYFASLASVTLEFGRFAEQHVTPTRLSGPHSEQLRIALYNLILREWGKAQYIISHNQVPFLQKVVQLLDFESAEAIFELQESSEGQNAHWMTLGNLRFLFTHSGGWRISEKFLSYGQKRMLAFLYYLSTVSSVVVADELVNGLHHRWIRACIEELGERQVFLTSQNPLLLDYLTFDNPEQVRATFILSAWEGTREHARMRWENMSPEAAEDFFSSYKVGFQQVGELLQSKGLW